MEIDYGRFTRQVALGAEIDVERAKATYERGILTIVLPLAKKPASAERVEIRVRIAPMSELIEEQVDVEELELPSQLPVLPLKDTVVFPDSVLPLAIGQERSVRLVDAAVGRATGWSRSSPRGTRRSSSPAGTTCTRSGRAAVVQKMIRVPDGSLRILVQGIRRIRLIDRIGEEPYLVGRFLEIPDVYEETPQTQALSQNVQSLFARLIGLVPYLPEELALAAANVEDPSALCHLVASTLRLKTEEKQQLLEQEVVEKRLRSVLVILNRELEVAELGSKIQNQVASEMESSQREYFLRQQLKAIQEELGEGDPEQAEVNELRDRANEVKLPEEARKAVDRELARLERLPAASAEYGVIRTYLEWILSLPWDKETKDNLDLEQARKVLDADHFDLDKVKERIIEHLAVSKLKEGDLSGPILCFVGPPGVGKTSLGQSIAKTLGRKFVRISVGGVRDEAEIRGHRRTYIGAMPGTIIRALRDAETINPVFLIDEIDKMGADWRGDPASAMLEVLDPEQHSSFRDHYLDLPVRPLEGPLHLHGEPAGDDPAAAPRPDGRDPALRLHRGREARDRQEVPRPEAAEGARAQALAAHVHRQGAARRSSASTRARRACGSSSVSSRPCAGRRRAGSPRARPRR